MRNGRTKLWAIKCIPEERSEIFIGIQKHPAPSKIKVTMLASIKDYQAYKETGKYAPKYAIIGFLHIYEGV